ncbi:MAG: cyclase family protein [Planctomycetota bacterium]|nr:MAG: cyclase family protein [Planctomycetota bacterium]
MRVLEKCGYACESRQRRAGVKDGQVMDVLLYVRLRAAPAPPRRRFVELSHPIEDAMVTYPGLPAPRISAHMDRAASAAHYAPGTTFHIGRIDMVANTGTYLDAPFHRWADGLDLAALPLDRCAELEGRRVRVPDARAADAACFLDQDLDGMAVLIHTGWSRHWRTPQYAGDAPFLTEAGACRLRAAGAALVGIDSINIDDRADPRRPAHSVLLEAGIPIVEHLTGLDQLPERGFRFSAAPARVAHMGSFPVRAYAVLED